MQTTVSSQHFNNLMENSNFIDTGIRCKSHLDKVEGIEPGHYLRVWNVTEYKIFKLPCDIRDVPIFKSHIYRGDDVAKNYLLDQGFYVPKFDDINPFMIKYRDYVDILLCKINIDNNGEFYMRKEKIKEFANEAKRIENLPECMKDKFERMSNYGVYSIDSSLFKNINDELYTDIHAQVKKYGSIESFNEFGACKSKNECFGDKYSYRILTKYCGNPYENFRRNVIIATLILYIPVSDLNICYLVYDFLDKIGSILGFDILFTFLGLVFELLVTILISSGIALILSLIKYRKICSRAKRLLKIYEEIYIDCDKSNNISYSLRKLKEKYFNYDSLRKEEDSLYLQKMDDLANCTSVSIHSNELKLFNFGGLDTVYNCLFYFGFPFTFDSGELYRPFYPQEQRRFYGEYQNNLYQVKKYNDYLNKFVLPIIRQNQIEIIDTNLYTLNKYLIEDLRIQMRTDQICNSINSLKETIHNDSLAIMGQLQKMNRDINQGLREIDNSINNLDMTCYVSTYVTVRD